MLVNVQRLCEITDEEDPSNRGASCAHGMAIAGVMFFELFMIFSDVLSTEFLRWNIYRT